MLIMAGGVEVAVLRRKIEDLLRQWKNDANHKPLIIKGCRQCGKTWSVRAFARKEYKHVVYLNFFENPDYKRIFSGSLEVDHLTMMITAVLGAQAQFVEDKTVIILDEIQECPQARTSLKFFYLDGRYDVIGTGSLLGVRGYGPQAASIPVGYETVLEMYPLDFEEFLWSQGINESIIAFLQDCLEKEIPVPDPVHQKMYQSLLQYAVVGGMPEVVQSFVNTKQLNSVLQLQRNLVASYQDDMVKYADRADKGRIRACFTSIPKQLSKENKKFQYSVIKKGSSAGQYEGSLQWIEDAGIISRCYNLTALELPLAGNAVPEMFKVYMNDTGLLVSMLEDGTQYDLLQGDLYTYKGAVFENLIAGMLRKMGRSLYYYRKESGLEIDFVMRYRGQVTLVEVKASTGNTKSTKTVLAHPEKYHVSQAIKLGDYNVGRAGAILTLPHYLTFLLRQV